MSIVAEEILTPDELAERLKLSKAAVYKMVGEGAPVLRANHRGKMRFVLSEVVAWMRSQQGTTA